MIHNPFFLLIPLAGVICIILIVMLVAKPLALLAYLRAIQAAHEVYRKLYIPYVVLPESDQDTHRLILGPSGAGKTMIMRTYAATAVQNRRAILRGRDKIPLYIPLKHYNLYLKSHVGTQSIASTNVGADLSRPSPIYRPGGETISTKEAVGTRLIASARQRGTSIQPRTTISPSALARNITLLKFLRESDLPGMRHLRRRIKKLIIQGRILFLCDGLDEIDPHYLEAVSVELASILLYTSNHLIITSREMEYRAQPHLQRLVDDGQLEITQLHPLQPEQIRDYVEHYISEQDGHWRHTAGQIMEVIDSSRLRDHCTNPMLLFAFMEVIDHIGIQRGKEIDTRGLLLREYVSHMIEREYQHAGEPPAETALLAFLGEIANAARWADDRTAIKLRMSTTKSETASTILNAELAEAMQVWLDEHPTQGPFATGTRSEDKLYDPATLPQLLQYAQRTGLIDVSTNGIVSFRHDLLAAYLLAAYLSEIDSRQHPGVSFNEELLADAPRWSDVIAIWAGLLDDPLLLAERLATGGRSNPEHLLEALSLSLICIGVVWTPPQAVKQQTMVLPAGIKQSLEDVLLDSEAREKLAHLITQCAEEGAVEIYRALFALLDLEGMDTLLALLDQTIVPDMLFNQLVAVVDDAAYEAQVKRLIQVLGQLGSPVVAYAAEWSQPESGRSMRLRAAMVNILGRTNDQSAVEPLLTRLSDPEPFIRGRAINALIRLGPDHTLSSLIQALERYIQDSGLQRMMHHSILTILERYLNERVARHMTSDQSQRILEAILSVHSSKYLPETQQQALDILVRQANAPSRITSPLAGSITTPIGDTSGEGVGTGLITSTGRGTTSVEEAKTSLNEPEVADVSHPSSIDRPAKEITTPTVADAETFGFQLMINPGASRPPSIEQSSETSSYIVINEALDLLVHNLSSENEEISRSVVQALQIIGPIATPLLLAQLEQQSSEVVRLHIIEVFTGMVALDQRALPYLLRLLADPVPAVQRQAANALRIYAPNSIPGLIELVLFDANEAVATGAIQVLGDIGAAVVEPITQALSQIVPGRTRLLVHVLERVHDPQAIPALIALLQTPDIEPLLAIAIIHALCQNPDARVVPPLLAILAGSNVQVIEEAINALSYLGEVALPGLIAALGTEAVESRLIASTDASRPSPVFQPSGSQLTSPEGAEDMARISRIHYALLGMMPFPAEQLIAALAVVNDNQAEQIMTVLLMKGSDAAQVLVTHLADSDERVRGYVRQTLTRMEGRIAVPALLTVLHQASLYPEVEELLYMHLQEAIPQLVGLLGNPERGNAAGAFLLGIGPSILPSLIPALDDVNKAAQEHAQHIIVDLVRHSPTILPQVVHLFSLSLPHHAYEALQDVLTDELADVSISALLEGLENVYVIEGVSEALTRLVEKQNTQSEIALQGLFAALLSKERQQGAKIVLANIGVYAVPGLINLIADPDQSLASAAQDILRDIGVVAFPAIWAASSDVSNRARREAALSTFRSMPTVEIKDGLIDHLLSNELEDVSMALGLLLERINSEAMLPRADQTMIRALLDHLQTQNDECATQRIIALLLLVGGSDVANQIAWGLYNYHNQPGHQQQLTQAFLLLGKEAEEVLLEMLHFRDTPSELLAEVVGVLGMMAPHQDVYEYAKAIGNPGQAIYQTNMTYPERLEVALRALGGLLAGGHLNSSTLQIRQGSSLYGSPEHELYSVLLGKPYSPLITKLENDLRTAQYEHEKDRRQLVIQLLQVKQEHEQLTKEVRQLEAEKEQLEAINRRLEEKLRHVPKA